LSLGPGRSEGQRHGDGSESKKGTHRISNVSVGPPLTKALKAVDAIGIFLS